MMNDSVREELQLNISAPSIAVNIERTAVPVNSGRLERPVPPVLPPARPARTVTSELPAKTTNPTLVGFQNQNAAVPDWRLQLQNAVRQRTGNAVETVGGESAPAVYQKQLVTSGANALKAEYVAETDAADAGHVNPKVAAALRRIEQSRRQFSPEETPRPAPQKAAPAAARNYPFNVVSRAPGAPAKPVEAVASVNVIPKPKLVSSLRLGKEVLDTNKLPPLPDEVRIASSFEKPFSPAPKRTSGPLSHEVIHIPKVEEEEPLEELVLDAREPEIEVEAEEIEDLAPFSVRFNAGLFDLIIGAFAGMVLLSPFVLMGGNWFTWAGLFAFIATVAVVMFLYLTVCLGLFGKTLGMRIFSLEVVDVEESAYPTFHQAALSSTLYLLSLAFGGIGFLTVPFNEERRAMHDLLSGTIVVKEF